jgi:fumarate hydratase subunit beta
MEKRLTLPLKNEDALNLQIGDYCFLTGEMYAARDAAHKRLFELIKEGEPLPIDIDGETIYYMGPSPAREGKPIGSAGPTTAASMDKYTPTLLDMGLRAIIDAEMSLGEGSGAVLLMPMLSSAVEAFNRMETFSDIEVEAYQRFR